MENIHNTPFLDKKLYFMIKFRQFRIPEKFLKVAQKMSQVLLHGLVINFK